MEVSCLNAAVLKGGEFLNASDTKKERMEKKGFPYRKKTSSFTCADNKTNRKVELFTSLILLLSVGSLISCQSSVLRT